MKSKIKSAIIKKAQASTGPATKSNAKSPAPFGPTKHDSTYNKFRKHRAR